MPNSIVQQQSAAGKALMVDINLTLKADALPKFLFRKKDDTSIGFTLKKLFLGPLMRYEAKRQILKILSKPAFQNQKEAQALVQHIQGLGWDKGVDADKVSGVIASTILASGREPNGKAVSQWKPYIKGALQDEMVDAYLDNPVNLQTEILKSFENRLDVLPGLNKFIYCATHSDHEVSGADIEQMEKLMDQIKGLKDDSTKKFPFELDRKIREIFELAMQRFDKTSDKKNVRESQPEKSVGNKSDVPKVVTKDSTTTAIPKVAETGQSMTARRKALSNYMQEGTKAINDVNYLLLEKCSDSWEIFRPFALSINPGIDAKNLYDKLKKDLRFFLANTSDDIPL